MALASRWPSATPRPAVAAVLDVPLVPDPPTASGTVRDVWPAPDVDEGGALWRSRFRQSLRTRAVLTAALLPFVLADALGAGFLAPWRSLVALQFLVVGVNAGAWALDRAARVRAWHFWAVLAFDFAVLGALTVATGLYGYLTLPFLVVAVGRYSLGQPVAGRVGLGLAVVVYAVARVLGLRLAAGGLGVLPGAPHGAPPALIVGLELTALAAVGLVALWGPQAYTRRVARVRRALAALGGGALATRLATDDMDDLRPLAESFNRTAEALDATTAALCASEARHRAIFDHAAVGILLLDADGVICEANTACQHLLGYGADALRGTAADGLCPAEDASAWRAALRTVLADDAAAAMAPTAVRAVHAVPTARDGITLELRYRRRDGAVLWGALTFSRAPAASGAAVIAMVHDVTERKRLEAELERRASQDPLTGLANRAGLATAMRDALYAAAPGAERGAAAALHVAVLAVDLDGFKAVNDTYGHAAGDRLLQAVTARLLDATRGSDLVARLGGDEFVVLLRQTRGPGELRVVAERIVAALGAPYPLGSSHDGAWPTARIGASVGGALLDDASAGRDAADDPDADGRAAAHAAALLRDADRALYQAKALGRGRAVLFGSRHGPGRTTCTSAASERAQGD